MSVDADELNAAVYTLLAKSRWARDGAGIAADHGDGERHRQLCEKADRLMREANEKDPGHGCAAWADHSRGTN